MEAAAFAYPGFHVVVANHAQKISEIMRHAFRKRHRRIWIILAIVLPILFVLAVLAIPEKTIQNKLYQPIEKTLN